MEQRALSLTTHHSPLTTRQAMTNAFALASYTITIKAPITWDDADAERAIEATEEFITEQLENLSERIKTRIAALDGLDASGVVVEVTE